MNRQMTEQDLRKAWTRLHLLGEFDQALRQRAIRRVLESVARASAPYSKPPKQTALPPDLPHK